MIEKTALVSLLKDSVSIVMWMMKAITMAEITVEAMIIVMRSVIR